MEDSIVSLYRAEIDILKQQVDDLKDANEKSNSTNASLNNKIRNLENIIEQAAIANQDLNDAFGYVNRQLRETGSHQVAEAPRNREPDQALEHQYYNLARQSISWVSERDKMDQRIKFLERECQRYERDNTTLGKQVRHLLKSLEEERGMIVRRQRDIQQQLSCAADVIDEHLVTFESIEELQKQNQKLLSLVKEMTAREEERETVVENEEIRKLNLELDELRAKLDKTESDRENMLNALNTIYKERDLFKILLSKSRDVEHMTPEIFQRMVSVAISSGPVAIADAPESSIEKSVLIDHLRNTITKLEQELVDLKKEFKDEKAKFVEDERLKSELLEKANMRILSESMRADTIKERNDVLQQNLRALTTEFDEMRTKHQKMTFEFDQLKHQCESFESDLKTRTAQYEVSRTELQRVTFELEQLRKQHEAQETSLRNLNADYEKTSLNYQRKTFEFDQLRVRQDELERRAQDLSRTVETLMSLRNTERENRLKAIRRVRRLEHRLRKPKSTMPVKPKAEPAQEVAKRLEPAPPTSPAKPSPRPATTVLVNDNARTSAMAEARAAEAAAVKALEVARAKAVEVARAAALNEETKAIMSRREAELRAKLAAKLKAIEEARAKALEEARAREALAEAAKAKAEEESARASELAAAKALEQAVARASEMVEGSQADVVPEEVAAQEVALTSDTEMAGGQEVVAPAAPAEKVITLKRRKNF